MDIRKAAKGYAAGSADVPDGALAAYRSHIEGRNATVVVYPDRIEWTRKQLMGRGDTNTIMLRHVTQVRTHKRGLAYTEVEVLAGASGVTMRVTKAQADQLRQLVTEAQR